MARPALPGPAAGRTGRPPSREESGGKEWTRGAWGPRDDPSDSGDATGREPSPRRQSCDAGLRIPRRVRTRDTRRMDDFIFVDGEGLDTAEAYRLVIGCVVTRPVAWITTVDAAGRVNAAPFSSYNYVA